NFAPELVGCGKFTGEMAEWLAENGHEVRAVTAPPFNPASKVSPGYSAWRYRREKRVYNAVTDSSRRDSLRSDRAARSSASDESLVESKTASAMPAGGVLVSDGFGGAGMTPAGSLSVFRCPLWVPRTPSAVKRALHLASFAFSSFWSMLLQIPWRPQVVLV